MKTSIINITILLLSLSCVYLHPSLAGSHSHRPHYNTRSVVSQPFTKEELNNFLHIEYIIDGDKKTFGELNDVMFLKTTGHHIRNKKDVKEEDKEMHITVGDPNVYYCYNILAPYLSVGQKIKITCPNAIPSKTVVGRIPYKNMIFEIEVLALNKAWKLQEVIDTFKVEYLTTGDKNYMAHLGDTVVFEYYEYNAKTNEKLFDWKDYNSGNYDHKFKLGSHLVNECLEIVLTTAHMGQDLKFYCPQKYNVREGRDDLDYEKLYGLRHPFDTYIVGHLKGVIKHHREEL